MLRTTKITIGSIYKSSELRIQFGRLILLENIGEKLDLAFESILLQQKTKTITRNIIKIGNKTITYN